MPGLPEAPGAIRSITTPPKMLIPPQKPQTPFPEPDVCEQPPARACWVIYPSFNNTTLSAVSNSRRCLELLIPLNELGTNEVGAELPALCSPSSAPLITLRSPIFLFFTAFFSRTMGSECIQVTLLSFTSAEIFKFST